MVWTETSKITVADWRKDTTGPMQVVSGALGKEKVHFEAPNSSLVEKEMKLRNIKIIAAW